MSSLLFGLLIGCVTTLVLKTFFQYVEDPQWIERHLKLTNMAIIPYSKEQALYTMNRHKSSILPLLASKYPNDLSIEALRSLRTSLQVLLCSATNNIVSIVGISPGTGKSFISANFAYLLAQAGKRVLLIDGDLRRGYLQQYFQATQQPGLSELINKTASLENTVIKTQQKNLLFLPTGSRPVNPSELLTKEEFKELIQSLSPQFDLIIIDTAPILAVTDGALIAALSGTNFLVVGSHSHQPKEIELAITRLMNAGVNLHGFIFNYKKEKKTISSIAYHYEYSST
jgi:tyrosine-protein kinase Etk/Wzc